MGTTVLDQTLDTLAADDLTSATDTELHDRMLGLLRGRVRLDGLLYATIDVWDTRGIWSGDGSKSPASRLKAETGIAKTDASTLVRRSRKLRHMPLVAAAVTVGRLQPGCVDALSDARKLCADIFHQHEQTLVDACTGMNVDDARRVIRNWIRHHDPDADENNTKKRHAGRQLGAAATFDGMVHLNGLLPAVGGQEFLAELNRLERQLYEHDQATGEVRTATQRRTDALVLMAERSATLDIDEHHAGRSPRISLTLVLGMNTAEHLRAPPNTSAKPSPASRSPHSGSCPPSPAATSNESGSTARTTPSPPHRNAPSPERYAKPSKSATNAAPTPPAATHLNRPGMVGGS